MLIDAILSDPGYHGGEYDQQPFTLGVAWNIFELMANSAGVPAIAMDPGSCCEVIQDGQTGFLVKNVAEAIYALERLRSQ